MQCVLWLIPNIPLNWLNPPILFTKQKDLHHPNLFCPIWKQLFVFSPPDSHFSIESNQSLTYKLDRKTFLREFSINFCWFISMLLLGILFPTNLKRLTASLIMDLTPSKINNVILLTRKEKGKRGEQYLSPMLICFYFVSIFNGHFTCSRSSVQVWYWYQAG